MPEDAVRRGRRARSPSRRPRRRARARASTRRRSSARSSRAEQHERVSGYIDAGQATRRRARRRRRDRPRRRRLLRRADALHRRPTTTLTIAREEIFGPVLVAQPYESLEEVAARANDTEYGLAAGVWTRDVSQRPPARRAAARRHASTSTAGASSTRPRRSAASRPSGIGREHGHDGPRAPTSRPSRSSCSCETPATSSPPRSRCSRRGRDAHASLQRDARRRRAPDPAAGLAARGRSTCCSAARSRPPARTVPATTNLSFALPARRVNTAAIAGVCPAIRPGVFLQTTVDVCPAKSKIGTGTAHVRARGETIEAKITLYRGPGTDKQLQADRQGRGRRAADRLARRSRARSARSTTASTATASTCR